MNRAAAAEYLVGQFGSGQDNLLGIADIAPTDISGGLREPIDQALGLLGTAYGDLATATPADFMTYQTALRYTGLLRILDGMNGLLERGRVKSDTEEVNVQPWIERTERMLDRAAAACQAAGLNVTVGTDAPSGWAQMDPSLGPVGYNLDYLQIGR